MEGIHWMSGKSIYANMTCLLQGLFGRFSLRGGRGLPYESDVRGCSSTLVGLSVADLGLSWAVQHEKLIFLSLQISLWVA